MSVETIDFSGLTRQQHRLLRFIATYSARKEIAPSFDEMSNHMGLNSKSGIHRLITSLEERGKIQRLKGRARAIRLVANDPDTLSDCIRAVLAGCNLSEGTADELQRILHVVQSR